MQLPRWLVPWRKQTDQNAVTPIVPPYTFGSRFGTVVEAFSGMWAANLRLDSAQSILAFSAVYSCLSLISSDISKLGLKLRRRNGAVWEDTTNPAFSPVLRKPNRYQTRIQFFEYWLLSKLITGNTYVLKERDARNVVVGLYLLDPSRVKPLVAPDGEVFYQLAEDWLAGVPKAQLSVPASEIIHDRAKCLFHPLVGVAPLFACAASTMQGTRFQANSRRFFENMSRPSGQLTSPGRISDETANRLKADFEARFSGDNLGRLLVTGDGLKFEPMTMPADQAQLIDQLKFTVEDVARAFGVPLYKVQAGQNPTFNNVGALNQEYYQQALQPHIESIEVLLDEGLALPGDMGVEFDLDGLLRMDPKTRFETHEIGVRSAVLTPNEARRSENLPPVEGGDTPYLQQQNYSLAALAKRDESDDPFGKGEADKKPAALPPPEDEEASDEEARSLIAYIRQGLACPA